MISIVYYNVIVYKCIHINHLNTKCYFLYTIIINININNEVIFCSNIKIVLYKNISQQ